MIEQSKRKLAPYVDATNPDELRRYKGVNSHAADSLLATREEYGARFHDRTGIKLPWLVPFLAGLGIGSDFFESI